MPIIGNGKNKGVNVNYAIDTSDYIRKLSNIERMYLWSPYSDVSMVTRIKGNISEEKLRSALDIVLQMHPLAGAKIVFDEDYNAWFSTDNVFKPFFKTVNRISDTQWLEELQGEVKIPFNPETGPMIRFVLVYSEKVSDLVVICNHSVCDGMSLVYLIRDLLDIYTHPEQEIKVIEPVDIKDFLPKGGFSLQSVMMKLVMGHANSKWKKNPYYFDHNDAVAVQDAYWEKYVFNTVLLELEPQETKSLLKQCRNKGISIGSAVIAAFIAAHEDIVGTFVKNQKQLWVPFDLRRHATTSVGDVFGLCIGAPRFSYNYNAKKPFWGNAAVLHKEIHERVAKLDSHTMETPDSHPTFMDALSSFALLKEVVPEAYTKTENLKKYFQDKKNITFSFAKRSRSMVPGTIPSNLGRLNIPETYGDLKIDRMIFFPVISDSVPLNLGGLSIGNKMVFSLSYPESRDKINTMTGEMIQIRNRALEYLGFPDKASEKAIEDTINGVKRTCQMQK
ncbi:condensation domain-containing protein [Methanobacterium sp.]|uniref:condensation domain-containing protein n=1 Tax=Methanobacterium sp. TaxID=2164 RepID=UPI003C740F16